MWVWGRDYHQVQSNHLCAKPTSIHVGVVEMGQWIHVGSFPSDCINPRKISTSVLGDSTTATMGGNIFSSISCSIVLMRLMVNWLCVLACSSSFVHVHFVISKIFL